VLLVDAREGVPQQGGADARASMCGVDADEGPQAR